MHCSRSRSQPESALPYLATSRLTQVDAVDGRYADIGDPFARREAIDQLRDGLHKRVVTGGADRLDQSFALALGEIQAEVVRNDKRER